MVDHRAHRSEEQLEPLVGFERSGVDDDWCIRRKAELAAERLAAAGDRRIARPWRVFDQHGRHACIDRAHRIFELRANHDDDLRSVVLGPDGAFAGMKPGAIFIDHTTASADVARELYAQAKQLGLQFVDAPVSGGSAGAQNGMLTVMCGGDAAAFEAAKPVAMALARAFTLLGPAGAGQLAKMVNQIAIAGMVQGLSEAISFGQKSGLDMLQVLEVIGKGAAQSWQMDNRGKTMIEGKFDYGFAVDWMRKDLGLCLDEAKRNGARLPVTALVDQFYADVQALGGKRWDTSSLITRLK